MSKIAGRAQQQSEQIRGEGDGERNRIFAEAYGADPEFFASIARCKPISPAGS